MLATNDLSLLISAEWVSARQMFFRAEGVGRVERVERGEEAKREYSHVSCTEKTTPSTHATFTKKRCLKICRFKNIVYFCALFHRSRVYYCCCSSVVEHFLGKEEVVSSSLINSSK